jgi:Fic family protein
LDSKENKIIDFLSENEKSSSRTIFENGNIGASYSTLKRILSNLLSKEFLVTRGRGKATIYLLSPKFKVVQPIDLQKYYEKEIDDREIFETFNFSIVRTVLAQNSVFTKDELIYLKELQDQFNTNIQQLSTTAYKKELDRLAIDLSWKSSQIEGNTYSLLETERLLKEKETADGKTKEEATMLLNHKEALDFIIQTPDYLNPLKVSKIEDVHSILMQELDVERNLRKQRVGISGTNYQPLNNEFQIVEALKETCELINNKKSVFEKALLALVLISYIQPFMDGNKRTARIVSNAILIDEKHCPLSFRTVNSIDYKKAMLLFYEQNNISAFKKLFIGQFEFAVNTYF